MLRVAPLLQVKGPPASVMEEGQRSTARICPDTNWAVRTTESKGLQLELHRPSIRSLPKREYLLRVVIPQMLYDTSSQLTSRDYHSILPDRKAIADGVYIPVYSIHDEVNLLYSNRPPKTPAAAPTKPPPNNIPFTAAPPVEACTGAEPVLDTPAEAEALPDPGAGVMLAVDALLDAPCAEVCEAAVELAPAEPVCASLSAPAVIVTVMLPRSVLSYVVVLEPGKFASLPPAVSLQTALLEAITQSWVAVKSVFGSDMSILYVDGPTMRVCAGNRPQSVSMQARARVVASLLAPTTDAAIVSASPPTSGTMRVFSC